MSDTFPRQHARTKRFSLGVPRSFLVSPDGTRVVFLRGKDGTDPVTCLWALDLPGGAAGAGAGAGGGQAAAERLIADPAAFSDLADEPEEERARRERSRELAGGVVAFAADTACDVAAFAVAGQVYTTELTPGGTGPRKVNAKSPAIDPRPDPSGRRVAYVCEGALRVVDPATGVDTELIGPGAAEGADADADVTYGLAEFVAAEEMGRYRGYWWAPDGSAILVARADNSPVQRWHIADPVNPGQPPTAIRYPSAGTPNAQVSLLIARLDGAAAVPVSWDDDACPYLVAADWDAGDPLVIVQSRDQRLMRLLTVNPETGGTQVLREDTDASWLDIVPGLPARTSGGRVVWTVTSDDTRRLLVAEPGELSGGSAAPVTPPALQVRAVLSVDGDTVLFSASDGEPAEVSVWAYGPDGLVRISAIGTTDVPAGVHGGIRAGGTTVLTHRSMAEPGLTATVLRGLAAGGGRAGLTEVVSIASVAQRPLIGKPRVTMLRAGQRELRTALVLPSAYEKGSAPLPVLMDPYGGPHSQRVLATADSFLTSQWFADQGFAVIVSDGRGTPGRGPAWDRAVAGDLASLALEDQVDALAAVAELCASQQLADLDLTKVGIRGWSYGGYLSALAVLRRPDVFHAGVAGAPVTDWRLYDTHYTERYLGDPAVTADAYDRSSLIADAAKLSRPLMIIHGLADDNVVVAHSLRLSSALLAAGRAHFVLPLSGVTHLATGEEVAENLLLLQVDFLKQALGV